MNRKDNKQRQATLLFVIGCLIWAAPVIASEADTLVTEKPAIVSPVSILPWFTRITSVRPAAASPAKSAAASQKKVSNLKFSGYARFWGFYRNMPEHYDIAPAEGLTLPVNLTLGDGYEEPLLMLDIEGRPTASTFFKMEYFFDNRLLRAITNRTDSLGRSAKVYRQFYLTGGVYTKNGTFKLIAGGGVNWYKLSPFTIWNFQYRDDMFERYPWEPKGSDWNRYNSFYAVGDIPRDIRWGNRGTQGFIFEAKNLPYGFGTALLYGKSENSGGFQSFLSRVPRNMASGRVDKTFGSHLFGVNFYNEYGYEQNNAVIEKIPVGEKDNPTKIYRVETNRLSQKIATTDFRLSFPIINIFGEFGAGSYLSSSYNEGLPSPLEKGTASTDKVHRYERKWTPLAFLELDMKKELTFIPVKVAFYNIGERSVNNTSTIYNTSIEGIKQGPDQGDQYNTTYFDGMVTEIGQLANNRRGVNLFIRHEEGKLKVQTAVGISQEIKNLYNDPRNGVRDSIRNSITFQHRLNALPRSRFAFFERFTGPYGRIQSLYRRTFENIAITDPDPAVNYKKSFSSFDLSLKYKMTFFGKSLILSNYVNYNSVQDQIAPLPVTGDKAFLRILYEEFMAFYQLNSKLTLVGFAGMERVKGNKRTELADAGGNLITDKDGKPVFRPEGKPVDQLGHGLGLGLDYNYTESASLHIRHRWYAHEDRNFTKDVFRGNELTLELKVFFY